MSNIGNQQLGDIILGSSGEEGISAGYGQAQAQIKSFDINKFAQTQAQIKQTYYQHGQAQANIGNSYQVYGQAQASIRQFYNNHAQAQASILQTYSQHGQAQAQIKQTYNQYGQAQGLILVILQGYGQSNASIKQTYPLCVGQETGTGGALLGSLILGENLLGQTGGAEEFTCVGLFGQAQASILDAGFRAGYGQAQALINQTYNSHGQSQGWVEQTYFVHGQSQANIERLGLIHGQAQSYILGGVNQTGQAQGIILQTYNMFGQAQSSTVNTYTSNGQAQALILRTEKVFGQAQSQINAFDVNKYGQSQTSIKQNYTVYSQSQATIVRILLLIGQAQASIVHGPGSNYYVLDTFTRTTAYGAGLGNPDIGPSLTPVFDGPFDNYDTYARVVNGELKHRYNEAFDDTWVEYLINVSDIDYRGEFRFDESGSGNTYIEFDARQVHNESSVTTNVYTAFRTITSWRLATSTGTTDVTLPFTFSTGVKYAFHLQIEGTNARVNVWLAGESEPVNWLIERTGATAGQSGSIGFYVSASTHGRTYIDNISVLPVYSARFQTKIAQTQAYIHVPYGNAQAQALIDKPLRHAQASVFIYPGFEMEMGQSQATITGQYLIFLDTFTREIDPTTSNIKTLGLPDAGTYTNFFAQDPAYSSGTRLETVSNSSNNEIYIETLIPGSDDISISFDFYADAYSQFSFDGMYQIDTSNSGSQGVMLRLETRNNPADDMFIMEFYDTSQLSIPFNLVNGQTYRMRLAIGGTTFLGKIWNVNDPEPEWLLVATQTAFRISWMSIDAYIGSVANGVVSAIDNISIYSTAYPSTQKYGQSRALIHRYQGYGQARARIPTRTNRHGLARAVIITVTKRSHGLARAHIKTEGNNRLGQAQASIFRLQASGQSNARIERSEKAAQSSVWIENTYGVFGQSKALIELFVRKQAQAQAYLIGYPYKHGQVQASIYPGFRFYVGQTQAFILESASKYSGQSQALIVSKNSKYGQALGLITPPKQFYAQAQAQMIGSPKNIGQAQASISRPAGIGQAQAYIRFTLSTKVAQAQSLIEYVYVNTGLTRAVIIKPTNAGQAQARISAFGQRAVASSQAYIRRLDTRIKSGQTKAQIQRHDPVGQSQALIVGGRYLVKYNGYQLPGYAQGESIDSITRIHMSDSVYMDGPFAEYTGLNNKIISLQMKVLGDTYLDVKTQAQTAATIIRSSRGWTKLYIQSYDRYYTAINKSINIDKTVRESMKVLDYSMEFEAKPWLTGDTVYTMTGSGIISTDQVGRTYENGGWTPANLVLSGTNITVSGYTESGEFTGFISISGAVTNMIIDSQQYTSTINEVNSNDKMYNANYMVFVGPGKTYFAVNGATSCTIVYQDRWHL